MITNTDSPPLDTLAQALGDELRIVRMRLGWTRRQLQARLPSDISLQTLGTYELGTRRCSVARLVELCHAMDVLAHDVLARAYERTGQADNAGRLCLDLDRVVHDRQLDLMPLRRWAHQRLEHAEYNQSHAVLLDMAALESMAELCDVTIVDLIGRLRELDGRVPASTSPPGQAGVNTASESWIQADRVENSGIAVRNGRRTWALRPS